MHFTFCNEAGGVKSLKTSQIIFLTDVLTKTRNDLKPPEIPATIWNHLKPVILQYFLPKISYSQVEFILILHLKVFFEQLWSQKLKFSKLTKNFVRDTLLYPHFECYVYFSKTFVAHIFCANLVANLVQGHIARAYFNHLLHAVPALSALFEKRNAFFSTKNSKNTCRLGGCGVLHALNVEKWGVKTHNCALLLDFLAFLVIPHACPYFLE